MNILSGRTRLMLLIIFGVLAAAVTGNVVVPALATGSEGPTLFTGSSSSFIVGAVNSSAGAALRGTGSNAGIAVQGEIGALNTGVGIRGIVYGPGSVAFIGEAKATPPASPSIGLEGESHSGYGIAAETFVDAFPALFVRNFGSTTGVGTQSNAPGDAGIFTSALSNGVIGRAAAATAASLAGVLGQDLSTTGGTNSGVAGTSTNGIGVSGTSTKNIGVFGHAGGPGTIGALGTSGSGIGVKGFSGAGNGVLAESAGGPATPGPGAFADASLAVKGDGGSPLIIARGNAGTDVMSLDNSGNMILAGTLTTSGTPLVVLRPALGSAGVGTYIARQTVSTIEDVGEGRLVGGHAYVRLDPTLATVIDRQTNYLVFITPQGQTQGSLYVTQKSAAGFAVGETQGGRSTVAFDYRIVAKPAGGTEKRLPLVAPLPRGISAMEAIPVAPHYSAGFVPKLLRLPTFPNHAINTDQ